MVGMVVKTTKPAKETYLHPKRDLLTQQKRPGETVVKVADGSKDNLKPKP
jgi:hypothetical protein